MWGEVGLVRAAVMVGPGEIRLEGRPEPRPGPGEVEIAVGHVAICGSDLACFDGRLPAGGLVVFGHEFSGRVWAVASGVSGFSPGQAVAAAPLLNCGWCPLCLAGREQLCPQRRIFGMEVDGALQERVCLPASRVYPLPARASLAEGALLEPLAVAVHAVRQAGCARGQEVAVLGAGAIGLLIAQVARAQGAVDPLLVDIDPVRLRIAQTLGFRVVDSRRGDTAASLQAQTGGRGVDLLFEATGAVAVLHDVAALLAVAGTIVVVSRMEQPATLDLDALLLKEARLVTSRYFTPADFRVGLDLLAAGQVSLVPLIEGVMPFRHLGEDGGRTVMNAARRVVRLLISMDENEALPPDIMTDEDSNHAQ